MSDNNNEELMNKINNLTEVVIDILKKTKETSETIDSNFEILNTKIDLLSKDTDKQLDNVGGKLDNIQSELKKIEKVSRYSEEYHNLLKIS